MNILLICNKSPWPPDEGGPIAMNAMVEGLIDAGHNVKVLAINSNKYSVDVNRIPVNYREKTKIELVYIDLSVKAFPALVNLLKGKSYHVQRFITPDFSITLENILKKNSFDIVQLETLFIAPYIPLIRKHSMALIFLRAHNVEHLIWERVSNGEKNILKRLYLKHLAATLKDFELNALKKVDGVIAITPVDANFFSQYIDKIKVISIPFGIQPTLINKYHESNEQRERKNVLFHLGSMNWMPNIEGIRWFLNEVWPEVKRKHPDLQFHLAGRQMPKWLYEYTDEQTLIDGEIPNAIEYMKSNAIMVVPLFSGSGIRIKIIEGMLAGCAIITTTIGAEGINYSNGEHLLIADDKQEFIACIDMLVQNKELSKKIGNNASSFIGEHHDNSKLIKQLETFYSQFSS